MAPPHVTGDSGQLPEISTPLSDANTEKNLRFIEDLHKLGVSKYIDMPQLVVVGDQSSGKSSALEAITRLPFPVDDTMCTRFATEVALHRSTGPDSLSVSIRMSDGPAATPIDFPEIANLPFDSYEFRLQFKELIDAANKQILGGQLDNHLLSKATLQIKVKGPKHPNLTIVDIPGLVSVGHEAFETARSLVERYISNPKTIVLAVAHPADPGTQEVFQWIKKIPDRENRVIGVITKCDRKQEGAENWVLETIRNERCNNPHYLTQGWFGLRNRLPTEKDLSNDERDRAEVDFFKQGVWEDLRQPTNLGIDHLRSALVKMNNEHIKKTIPQLIPDIEKQLQICQSALDELGQPRVTTAEQSHCMVELASKFETLARDALNGNYHNLPDDPAAKVRKIVQESLDNFKEIMTEDYKIFLGDSGSNLLISENERTWRGSILADDTLNEIHRVILDNRGTEFPDEVNSNVMKVLWKERTTNWMEISTALVHKLVKSIGKSIETLFNVATKDSELRSNTKKWLAEFLYSSQDEAMEELNKILSDESNGFLWTLVPEYSLLVGTLYQEGIEAMVQCLKELVDEEDDEEEPGARNWEEELKLWLSANKDIDSLLMTYVRLNAYYRVAMARFIDNVGLQVVERHLLGKSSPLRIFNPVYVNKMAEENPDLLKSIAGENEAKATLRAEKIRERTSLKEALLKAQRYGFS